MRGPSDPPVATRDRILNASTELFGRHGYAATGIKSILAASGAPFGSLYHFFPGGKEALGAAAIRAGGTMYRDLVEAFYGGGTDVVEATDAFFEAAAEMIEATDFADACPIATVALEISSVSEPMRIASAEAFESWLDVLRARLVDAGIDSGRAGELAIELFCAIEGAFLLSRTTRDKTPILVAGRAVTASVRAAVSAAQCG
jgi:AcrR family transcriptional regulator